MVEAAGPSTTTAYIRKTQDHRQQKRHGSVPSPAREATKLLDKYCFFCGAIGHVTNTCKLMAKFITAIKMSLRWIPRVKRTYRITIKRCKRKSVLRC